jgi:hypothetical protein
MDTLVYTALANAFSSNGFKAERNENSASNRCEVTINENEQKLEAGTFYTPTVTIALTGKSGTLFTYSTSISRQGANNPDIAKRRAYTALAGELQKSFYEAFFAEFNRNMSEVQ